MKTLIIIPSRLSATRLPGKPLLKINDISIISHVFNKAKEANIGEVIVAAEDQEIVNDVKNNGGNAILTSNKHKTGTDRIYEAYQKLNLDNVDFIMNLQGDEPAINIQDIANLNQMMIDHKAKIGTLAAKVEDKLDLKNGAYSRNSDIKRALAVFAFTLQKIDHNIICNLYKQYNMKSLKNSSVVLKSPHYE